MNVGDFLPIVGMLVLFAVVMLAICAIVFQGARSRRRTFDRAMQASYAVANQMGWQFSRDLPWSSIPYANYFHLFTQGIGRRVYDMIHGEAEGVGISVFNYQFAAKATAAQTTQAQTVAMFQWNKINLPRSFCDHRVSSTSLGLPSPRRSAFRATPVFQINTC
jgi:hypothetical protein